MTKLISIIDGGIILGPYNDEYGAPPAGAIPITEDQFATLVANPGMYRWVGGALVFNQAAQLEKMQLELDAAVTDWIDAQAYSVGFKNAAYIVSYFDSTNSAWAAAARAFVIWRDGIWTTCIAIVDDVKAGRRAVPTAIDLIGELPKFSVST